MKKKLVDLDFFAHVKMPARLRAAGDALAFLMKQADMGANRYSNDLWLYKDGEAFPLTSAGRVAAFWWRGTQHIVYTRQPAEGEAPPAGETVLYELDLTRPGEGRKWLHLPHKVEDLAFLPDGGILFAAGDEGPGLPHGAREEDRDDYEVVTELPMWANGGGFTSGRHSALWLWQGGDTQRLSGPHTEVEGLRLSPSGRTAYCMAQEVNPVAPVANRLLRLDVATRKLKDVSLGEGMLHNTLLPLDDDTLLVFASDMRRTGLNQNGRFYRLDTRTGQSTLLNDEGGYSGWNSVGCDLMAAPPARWQAQGGKAYFVSTAGPGSWVLALDVKTGAITPQTPAEGLVAEFAFAGGRLFYTGMRGQGPAELYERLEDGSEACRTEWNTHLAGEYRYSVPKALSFTGRDGAALEGWVMKPTVPPAKGKKAPSVLMVHGGPKTVYGTVLFHEMQYLAARGFGVLFCNPRGSDGFGDAYSDIRGRYGTIDYEDILAFADAALAKHKWMDPKRMGISGGSYGGFMVNWVIGHTRRFAAAVSQRSISNWASMALTSDIGYYFEPDQAGTDVWQDAARLWSNSPLKYAPKAKTPTLFIHSDEDYRCPLPEGIQMYTALQLHGVKTRLCIFKGENHELSRSGRPRHRITRLSEITAWLEEHLKPQEKGKKAR